MLLYQHNMMKEAGGVKEEERSDKGQKELAETWMNMIGATSKWMTAEVMFMEILALDNITMNREAETRMNILLASILKKITSNLQNTATKETQGKIINNIETE